MSVTLPAGFDIEPVDPRAGGYTWTAVDGSVTIAEAVPEAPWADTLRDDVLGDSWAELSRLEDVRQGRKSDRSRGD